MVAATILHPIAPLQRLLHRATQLQQLRLLLVVLLPQRLHLEKKMLGDLTNINWEQNRTRAWWKDNESLIGTYYDEVTNDGFKRVSEGYNMRN